MMLEGGSPIFKQSQHKSFYSLIKIWTHAHGLSPFNSKPINIFCIGVVNLLIASKI